MNEKLSDAEGLDVKQTRLLDSPKYGNYLQDLRLKRLW